MSTTQCKITDVINTGSGNSYSFEVTPNIREDQLINMKVDPLFYSITWHATIHECRNLDIAPLKLAKFLRRNNKNVLLHLSCNLLRKSYLDDLLLMLQKENICNLLIILGEKYDPNTTDFKSTPELIRYIRKKSEDYFCIGVAAFPDRDDKLKHLKDKFDSGADFIITQAFFDVDVFADFLNKCNALGITAPILPGIFPFETENELTGFINLCKVHITPKLLEELKNQSGIEIVRQQINDISGILKYKHFHFFTLDKIERTLKLLKLSSFTHKFI
ncbi:5,10-methylenetetrahydrofolate reductase [Epargyreus clarus]|uniref:5,10-methylenetetrahydrofolate reductase n=1 Tax=Epargyreus clarus TaxID=520877 RepID=UPI003C2AEE00